jgi:hypothetical protein
VGYFLPAPVPANHAVHPENRVMGFGGKNDLGLLTTCRAAPQPRRENYDHRTETVPGIPFWPSRDPVGEKGGINVFASSTNDSVNRIDVLGEVYTSYDYPDHKTTPVQLVYDPEGRKDRGHTWYPERLGTCICNCPGLLGEPSYELTLIRINAAAPSFQDGSRTYEQTYGHEQRHILSRIHLVAEKVVDPLWDEAPRFYQDKDACWNRARPLARDYQNRLNLALAGDNHVGGDSANHLSPEASSSWDPIPGSAGIPAGPPVPNVPVSPF